MRDHSISLDQDRYTTYIVAKYLDTDTVKKNSNLYKTIFPYDMIFTKADSYNSYEQADK